MKPFPEFAKMPFLTNQKKKNTSKTIGEIKINNKLRLISILFLLNYLINCATFERITLKIFRRFLDIYRTLGFRF